jgi:hypothetical protein
MIVKEDDYQRKSHRSQSPGDPSLATHSTTTFSYQTGVQPGEAGKSYATVYQFRDSDATPLSAEL